MHSKKKVALTQHASNLATFTKVIIYSTLFNQKYKTVFYKFLKAFPLFYLFPTISIRSDGRLTKVEFIISFRFPLINNKEFLWFITFRKFSRIIKKNIPQKSLNNKISVIKAQLLICRRSSPTSRLPTAQMIMILLTKGKNPTS